MTDSTRPDGEPLSFTTPVVGKAEAIPHADIQAVTKADKSSSRPDGDIASHTIPVAGERKSFLDKLLGERAGKPNQGHGR